MATGSQGDDFLFVWTYDHGYRDGDNSKIGLSLWGTDYISDETFGDYVDYIDGDDYHSMAFVMGQCYSGGFINDLDGDKRVVLTSTLPEDEAYGFYFLDPFRNAISPTNGDEMMRGMGEFSTGRDASNDNPNPGDLGDPYNREVDYDTSHFVSISEAFYWAKWNDKAFWEGVDSDGDSIKDSWDAPQYDDDGTIGGGLYL